MPDIKIKLPKDNNIITLQYENNDTILILLDNLCSYLNISDKNVNFLQLKKGNDVLKKDAKLNDSFSNCTLNLIEDIKTKNSFCETCFEVKKLYELPCGKHYKCEDCIKMKLENLSSNNKLEDLLFCNMGKSGEECKAIITLHWIQCAFGQKLNRLICEIKCRIAVKRCRHAVCPECSSINEKTKDLALPHVKCGYCNTQFCFYCGQKWIGRKADSLCGNPSCTKDPIIDMLEATKNETRKISLSKNGGPREPVNVPSFRLCPACKTGCDASLLGGCKHAHCPSCQYHFCTLCLKHESECYHRIGYYWVFCSIAPLQTI